MRCFQTHAHTARVVREKRELESSHKITNGIRGRHTQKPEKNRYEKYINNFHTHSGSTFAVASSNIRILFFLNIARAKQSNCLWKI